MQTSRLLDTERRPAPTDPPAPATSAASKMLDTVFVLGNGPSLRGIDLNRFSGVATVGMNAAYREWERVGWYPRHYCCLDEELIATHHEAIRSLIAEGLVQSAFLTARILDFHPELAENYRCFFLDSFRKAGRWKKRRQKYGLAYTKEEAFETSAPTKVTTGAYAMRYAIFLGYRHVHLLGIDCNYVEILPGAREAGGIALEMTSTPTSNPNYFFDDYQQAGDRYNIPNPQVHDGNLHLQALEAVRDDVIERGLPVEIRNCSRKSKLASEGAFAYEDLDRALGEPLLGAIAVPMTFGDEEELIACLWRWSTPAATPRYPSNGGYAIPLVLVLNGSRDIDFESRITTTFEATRLCPASFSSLEFLYCDLSRDEDKYQKDYSKRAGAGGHKSGPNAQFFRAMELLRNHGRYVFMVETDCLAIRPNWLGELERIVEGAEPFWVLGSLYRGVGQINERYRVHINGNAVYAAGDSELQDFIQAVWQPAVDDLVRDFRALAYDCALPLYFNGDKPAPDGEKWKLFQSVAHQFRYTEFIQNHASVAELARGQGHPLAEIRDSSPRTYLVHGRHLLPAGQEGEASPFAAVAVHQMGKVGSRSLVKAVEDLQRWPCFHTHVLNSALNPSLNLETTPAVPPMHGEVPPHVFDSRDLRARFIDSGRPVAVITAVRDPIARNVSAFFQNIDGFVNEAGTDVNAEDPEELYELFRRDYPHHQPQRWIEDELNEPFGINVFARPFPTSGFAVFDAEPHRILLVKASLSDERKAVALGEFLGVGTVTVPRINVTRRKVKRAGRSAVLNQFKQCVGRDHAYIDDMIDMPMVRHFFTPGEREQIREQWLKLGRA